MSTQPPLFHLAIAVSDLAEARAFYGGLLGCREGRSSERWVDFDFFGHQLVTHLAPDEPKAVATNDVDGHRVPAKHFGVILPWDDWEQLSSRLADANVEFIIKPYVRFKSQPGEQGTMFVLDPSGNALEFKSFRDMSQVFAKR